MSVPPPDPAARLRAAVDAAMRDLAAIGDDESARRPAPDRWAPREIVGHLIDSASNNHGRFVRALSQDDLVFPGYRQDAWVDAQRYVDAPWSELLMLWAAFNHHLARVIDAMPADARTRPRPRHNLDRIAFRPVPDDEPPTLDWFMADYVDHLEHHLRQLLGPDWEATPAAAR